MGERENGKNNAVNTAEREKFIMGRACHSVLSVELEGILVRHVFTALSESVFGRKIRNDCAAMMTLLGPHFLIIIYISRSSSVCYLPLKSRIATQPSHPSLLAHQSVNPSPKEARLHSFITSKATTHFACLCVSWVQLKNRFCQLT